MCNKPQLRFKGFTEEWEQRKLGDVYDFQYGEFNNNPDNGGEYPIYGANGVIGGYTKYNAEDSAVIGHMGAYAGYVVWASGKHFVTYNGTIAKPSEDSIDSKFGYYILSQKQIYRICAGSGQPFVSYADLNGIDVDIPIDKIEQRKIGQYFSNLDHLITLHQRKLEKLHNVKKSMLQKMFPQNGSNVPEIRFKGFTGAWEQRKVGDLTKELSDYATMASGLPLLTSSRNGLMYQSDFRDKKTTNSDETLFSVVPEGTCTYRHMSDDDIFHLNMNTLEKGLVSREYPVFIASEGNDLEFVVQHINSSDRFRAFCKGQKKGGTRTRLYYKTLCEFEMMVPPIEEQRKISSTLSSLDHLITLHQRKCEKLKAVKKSLLERMFVN